MWDAIDADVMLHPLGFYELKPEYRKEMDSFYEDEYYQDSHALYRVEYGAEDLEYKNNLYRQKEYVVKTIRGGTRKNGRCFWISAAAKAMPLRGSTAGGGMLPA